MTKITFFETTPEERRYFKEHLPQFSLVFCSRPLSIESLSRAKNAEIISVFIRSRVTEETLDQLPNLRCIVTRSTGFDHIDIKACQKRGIVVQNLGDYSAQSVAEHTLALILALSSNLKERFWRVQQERFSFNGLIGTELRDKTLGVIGTGNIGKRVVKMALGLGMKVVAFDVKPDKQLAKNKKVEYKKSVQEVYKTADFLTFHVPLFPSTFHLFSTKSLKTVKKGVYIINTSRGEIVETKAILEGLEKGIIEGVALDVLENEKELEKNKRFPREIRKLLKHPRVLITPHTAFYTKESLERQRGYTVENILSFIKGKPLRRVV